MDGEQNVTVLIASMEPELDPEEYVFCTVSSAREEFLDSNCTLKFREKEGATYILKRSDAEHRDLSYVYPCKLITLNVHSSLDAVGFLAVITKRLAECGISVNAVSAYYHDHLFVPREKAAQALSVLQELANQSA